MKKLVYTLSVLFVGMGFMTAQEIYDSEMMMSFGKQTAYSVELDGVEADMAEDVFKKFMKKYGKIKNNKKAKEFYAEGAQVPMIAGSKDINVYMKFDEKVGMTMAHMWVDAGGVFVNSNDMPKEAGGINDFLSQYYVAAKKEAISKELKMEEKALKKMDKGLAKLEKKNKGYHKDIEKAKEKIEEAEKNIEQNLKDQEDKRMLIEQQKNKIEKVIERLNSIGKN